jgi:hypothetical protein
MKTVEKKKQQMRFTDNELQLIKNTFADNEDLTRAIRKTFLQMPLDPIDQTALKGYKGKEIKALLRKVFLPTLDPNAPPHQLLDLWMTVSIKDKTPDQVLPEILSREKLIAYIDQQLLDLDGEGMTKIHFTDFTNFEDKTPLECFIDLTVRNTLIAHVEMMLTQLVTLAGQKNETVEETKKRLQQDSSK